MKVHLSVYPDKLAMPNLGIDCVSRLQLCRARCCTYVVALSREDVEEGKIKFEIDEPYLLRREGDGYCTHLDRQTGACNVYAYRPAACRAYDCRKDPRVWLDFEQRLAAPLESVLVTGNLL